MSLPPQTVVPDDSAVETVDYVVRLLEDHQPVSLLLDVLAMCPPQDDEDIDGAVDAADSRDVGYVS